MTPSTPTNLPPLSPGSEAREKERVGLLLDINRDLLMEVMRLQALQTEIKKEMEGDPNPESKAAERKGQAHKDFLECVDPIPISRLNTGWDQGLGTNC